MRLPDFLIIGAQKSGTTWLARQMARHPEIAAVHEDLHFFDKAENYERGLDWYCGHFDGVPDGHLVGEKTADYLWANGDGAEGHLADVHIRIHRTVPRARLLVILRNPVDRALSALTHLVRTRRISPVHNVDALLLGKKHHLIRGHGVVSKGFYYRQLSAFGRLFDRSQVAVLIFEEDIARDPAHGLGVAWRLLGLEPVELAEPDEVSRNASRQSLARLVADYYLPPARPLTRVIDKVAPAWRPAPSERTLDELYQMFVADNEKLFNWLGRPVPPSWTDWRNHEVESVPPMFSSQQIPIRTRPAK